MTGKTRITMMTKENWDDRDDWGCLRMNGMSGGDWDNWDD